MTTILHSVVFPLGYPLIQRLYFDTPGGPYAVTAPANAGWVRASASGAGGFKDDAAGWGGGAAFAFAEESCAGSAAFTVQTGDCAFARPSANTGAGDSWVKRAGGSLLVSADRGRPDGSGGLVANSTGSVRRAGVASSSIQGGASAGDDADTYPLGFGGRGASTTLAAWFGGGGGYAVGAYKFPTFPAGDGRVCLEFYLQDPSL